MSTYKYILLAVILTLAPLTNARAQMLAVLPVSGSSGGGGGSTTFVTGQSLGSTRNNFSGCLGYLFTVGGANITVTDLGRWVVSGNSGSHVLTLDNASGTVLASVSVNTSGAPAAAFLYGSITPTVLTASTQYFVGSAEANVGDLFYDDPTTVTTTGDATVNASAFTSDGACVAGAPSGNTGGLHSYGPVSFKYHL